MQNNTPMKFVKLLASLIAATLVAGCSVGTAPTEPGGNSVKNGSLIWYVSAYDARYLVPHAAAGRGRCSAGRHGRGGQRNLYQ
jgi:hypothetical protein